MNYFIIYAVLSIGLYILAHILIFIVRKNIKNNVNNNIYAQYLGSEVINNLYKKAEVDFESMSEEEHMDMYIVAPVLSLLPLLGQYILFFLYVMLYNAFKVSSKKIIDEYCTKYFIEKLNLNYSNTLIGKDICLIENYSNINIKNYILSFLNNTKHPYYLLGFENFKTLVNLIKEQEKQFIFMNNEDKNKTKTEILDLINDYISLIKELNSKATSNIDTNNIKSYSNYLKSITDDLKNNKY